MKELCKYENEVSSMKSEFCRRNREVKKKKNSKTCYFIWLNNNLIILC